MLNNAVKAVNKFLHTKSAGNVHYDNTVYYKPRKYVFIHLLAKLIF